MDEQTEAGDDQGLTALLSSSRGGCKDGQAHTQGVKKEKISRTSEAWRKPE